MNIQKTRPLAGLALLALTSLGSLSCGREAKFESKVKSNMEAGQAAGVNGTPAFFINGRFLSGAQPIANFKVLIDEEMKKVEASGMNGADFYKKNVVEAGKKTAP